MNLQAAYYATGSQNRQKGGDRRQLSAAGGTKALSNWKKGGGKGMKLKFDKLAKIPGERSFSLYTQCLGYFFSER